MSQADYHDGFSNGYIAGCEDGAAEAFSVAGTEAREFLEVLMRAAFDAHREPNDETRARLRFAARAAHAFLRQ
jgi:hypothetical protein